MTTLLEVTGLTKRFGGVTAVDTCSFMVTEGTVSALIGPNGSGKTTVFNVITGYLPADSGSVTFEGRRVTRPNPIDLYRRGLTRTFQQSRVFGELSLIENLVVAMHRRRAALFGLDVRPAERSRAGEVLAQFGLADARGPSGP